MMNENTEKRQKKVNCKLIKGSWNYCICLRLCCVSAFVLCVWPFCSLFWRVLLAERPTYHDFDQMSFPCLEAPKQNTDTDPGFICVVQYLEEGWWNLEEGCSGNGGANGKVGGQSWSVIVSSKRAKIFDQMLGYFRLLASKTSVNCLKGRAVWEKKENEEDLFQVHCQINWWCKCREA